MSCCINRSVNNTPVPEIIGSSICRKFTSKIVLIGESSVGKSSLLLRIIHQTFQDNSCAPTVGLGYETIPIGTIGHKIQFWDTAGQETYNAIVQAFMRNSQVIIVVFSIVDCVSYQKVSTWISAANRSSPDSIIILVGNKTDCIDDSEDLIEDIAVATDYPEYTYIQTSAKSGHGTAELLDLCKTHCGVHN